MPWIIQFGDATGGQTYLDRSQNPTFTRKRALRFGSQESAKARIERLREAWARSAWIQLVPEAKVVEVPL